MDSLYSKSKPSFVVLIFHEIFVEGLNFLLVLKIGDNGTLIVIIYFIDSFLESLKNILDECNAFLVQLVFHKSWILFTFVIQMVDQSLERVSKLDQRFYVLVLLI